MGSPAVNGKNQGNLREIWSQSPSGRHLSSLSFVRHSDEGTDNDRPRNDRHPGNPPPPGWINRHKALNANRSSTPVRSSVFRRPRDCIFWRGRDPGGQTHLVAACHPTPRQHLRKNLIKPKHLPNEAIECRRKTRIKIVRTSRIFK